MDFGRINKRFYTHPKAVEARKLSPGSISLWLFCNCWCRDHRTQGIIPKSIAREMGSDEEISALLTCGLWADRDDFYEYHDWRDWNSDLVRSTPAGSAAWMVQTILGDHPADVQQRMIREVRKLVDEGIPTKIIEDALTQWGRKPGAGMSWLAYMASDAVRKQSSGVHAALAEAKRTGRVSALAEYGYRWEPPDAPPRIGPNGVREFMRRHKIKWIEEIEKQIVGA